MKQLKKFQLLLLTFIFIFTLKVKPDEGMWLLHLAEKLNYGTMKEMGLKLSAEEIYSINKASLKDAILSINNGMCTGFMVSKEGLMMTNHHCIIEYITDNAIKYNTDYLKDGFWATDKRQELYNPNLKVTFLVRIEDVSSRVLETLDKSLSDTERQEKIDAVSQEIVKQVTEGNHYEAVVKDIFRGNQFLLFVYESYHDVRLVGAPPNTISFFGGDTDNWLWPRQLGDFAFLRIYMAPDGKPAQYDKRINVPYLPKHYLPISVKGVEKDDFTMVLGYPGTTERFMTSYGVQHQINIINPTIVKIRDTKLRILKEEMKKDANTALLYHAKHQRIANYWKYYIGQTETLRRKNVFAEKQSLEKKFNEWINENPKRKDEYGDALPKIKIAYEQLVKYDIARTFFREAIGRGPDIFQFARQYDSLYYFLTTKDLADEQKASDIARQTTKLKFFASNYHFNSYDVNVDKKLFVELLRMYYDQVPKEFHAEIFQQIESKYKSNFLLFAKALFDNSIFSNKEKLYAFLREPNANVLENDIAFKITRQLFDKQDEIINSMQQYKVMLAEGERFFQKGITEMINDKSFYPDANSTLRLSYGKITTYTPTDGKELPYFTTIDEMIKREKPGDPEFSIPEKLKELYKAKDYGQYADKSGNMVVCILSDNDVTGGHSGAPLLNAYGEVLGVVFDINWEATASSIWYVENQTRTISTDIRYALFVTDKYAGAKNIIQELDIRK